MSPPSKSGMSSTSLRRSSLPVFLLVAAAVGVGLFFAISYARSEIDIENTEFDPSNKAHHELHWKRRAESLEDKHMWTTRNCHKGMAMMIELCPCIAKIDPSRSIDDIEESFVECVSDCIDEHTNITMTEDDYNDGDYKDDGAVGAKPLGVLPAGAKTQPDQVKPDSSAAKKQRRRR